MKTRPLCFVGLLAFVAFVAMAPPASAGVSFGLEYNDYIQLIDIETGNEWKPIVIGDGGSAIIIPNGGDLVAGAGSYSTPNTAITSAWKGGGGFGSRGSITS